MDIEFRKMRRFNQQLSAEECYELLRQEDRGILAIHGENGYPYAFPMNFCFDEKKKCLYLHSAKTGHKIDALRKDNKVCFCLHDPGYTHGGRWQKHFRSLVVFGHIEFVDDPEKSIECAKLYDLKFEPPEEMAKHIEQEGKLVQMMILVIDHMTGKKVVEG